MRQTLHTAKNEISTCESLCCSRGSRAGPTFERPTAAERGFVCCTVGRDVLVRRRRQRKRERRIAVSSATPGFGLSECQRRESAGADGGDDRKLRLDHNCRGGSSRSDSSSVARIERSSAVPDNFGEMVNTTDLAVSLARTAAFFSNDQAPLSSRTVRFISGIHFPPGIANTASADLYGIENTNRGCTLSTNYLPGRLFRCPLCRPHDVQSSRYHHRQGRPNGSRRKRHGSDRRCSDCRMPWII